MNNAALVALSVFAVALAACDAARPSPSRSAPDVGQADRFIASDTQENEVVLPLDLGGPDGPRPDGSLPDAPPLDSSPPIVAVQLTPSYSILGCLMVQKMLATAVRSNGVTSNVTQVAVWSSSHPWIASVSNSPGTEGWVTGYLIGQSMISATYGGITGTAITQVQYDPFVKFDIAPSSAELAVGDVVQVKAIGTYGYGVPMDVTSNAKWTSSNPGIATVTPLAEIAGVAPGTATITATMTTACPKLSASIGVVVE